MEKILDCGSPENEHHCIWCDVHLNDKQVHDCIVFHCCISLMFVSIIWGCADNIIPVQCTTCTYQSHLLTVAWKHMYMYCNIVSDCTILKYVIHFKCVLTMVDNYLFVNLGPLL